MQQVAPPVVLGKYVLGPRIPSPHCRVAHGGQSLSGREVVILLPDPQETDDVVARLEQLRHPRLVKIEALGNDDGQPTIVIEPPPAQSLREALNAGAVDDVALRSISVDVLTALGTLHRGGIAFGDIAHHNILIAADGTARLDLWRLARAGNATPDARRRDVQSLGALVARILQSGQTGSTDPNARLMMQTFVVRATASAAGGGLRSAPDALRVLQGDRTAGASLPPPPPVGSSYLSGVVPPPPVRSVARSPWAIAAAVVAVLAVLALLVNREEVGPAPGPDVSPTSVATTVPPTTVPSPTGPPSPTSPLGEPIP